MDFVNTVKADDLKKFINSWNYKFPIDYWWRKKYHIAFNSESHRKFCFIDMLLEYLEDKTFNQNNDNKEEDKYIAGDWLKQQEVTQEEIDNAFENMKI